MKEEEVNASVKPNPNAENLKNTPANNTFNTNPSANATTPNALPNLNSSVNTTTSAPSSSVKPKNKILAIALISILMIGSVIGVFFLVKSLQTPETIVNIQDLPQEESEKFLETSSEILFTEESLPRIDASLATQPLTDAFIKNFTNKTPEELNITYSNTHPSYIKLINNEADLIVVTEPSEDELALAAEKGVELEVTKVVNEGFAFFVNKDNPVSNVSFDDVVKIYTGEITNWKGLGGNDTEIIAYQRPENSGSQTGLYNLVLKDKQVKIPTLKKSVELSMAGIVDYVATYDNAIDSIGYGFYYYVNTMYSNDNLKYCH